MKGIGKALARTPFAVTTKIGMSKKSSDPEFDDYYRQFQLVEQGTDKLIKDIKAFTESVTSLFTNAAGFANHFTTIFQPIAGEFDLIGKHPDAGHTIRNVTMYQSSMDELQQLISPEMELIDTRVLAPVKEFQTIVKTVRKTITKRDHKLTDYDRHNNSLQKLRDKKDKSLSDEKNLFKLEQDFEIATNEYEYINTALKQDLPRYMQLSTAFIDPLFNSFFYMQLNIYYLILEKMQSYADGAKYDITNVPGPQIQQDYEDKRTDAWERIESLAIVKRIISVSRLVQQQRAQGGPGLSRANTTSTTTSSYSSGNAAPPSRATSSVGYKKAPPPPPPGSYGRDRERDSAPPPPYTPPAATNSYSSPGLRVQMPSATVTRSPSASSSLAATKRPPPPPPVKPKPKPAVHYVTALYDFDAQADGDLSFRAGERIELVKKTDSQEDWWTGRVNGQEGIFPGLDVDIYINRNALYMFFVFV
ncbi:BAR-domain-containing protein [Coprinopsis marcescibilis]|uniref:BAR-domain-containing protein n=1 Tax=Coprinopsis marcescibilis TaxID=230819 RepID=A0A5C3LC73_COPMA|nr:BAR-domain-containing protein [Coprinopsis marcescibilis]